MSRRPGGSRPGEGAAHIEAIFPSIQARNLEGSGFDLPQDFAGELNVVLVAFEQWQQDQVDSWIPRLTALSAAHRSLLVYEMPVISSVYSLARPFIDGGMAASIPSRDVRQRTLTVYTSLNRVTGLLQIEQTKTITLLLVDRGGRIYWRGEGELNESQAAALESTVAGLDSGGMAGEPASDA